MSWPNRGRSAASPLPGCPHLTALALRLEWGLCVIPHTQSRLLIPPQGIAHTPRVSVPFISRTFAPVTSALDYDGRCAHSGHRIREQHYFHFFSFPPPLPLTLVS